MVQQTSPFIDSKYGWSYGESGWNGGMDENLLKFSFLFDKNIDGIVSSLPAASNGVAYFLTTDKRIYFGVNNTWYSSPTPKWFILVQKGTGELFQFNGTQLNSIASSPELSASIQSIQVVLDSLGTAAFQPKEYFATQAALDVVSSQANSYTDQKTNSLRADIANKTDPSLGTTLVGGSARIVNTVADMLAIPTTATQPVFTLGYYAAGDGGGAGPFFWDATSSLTSNGGTIFGSGTGRWILKYMGTNLNLRMFGAKGDSVTNDTPSIQKALSASSSFYISAPAIVEVPPGSYFVSSTLVAPPNTHLKGFNRVTCRIIRTGDYGHTLTCGDDTSGAQGFKCTDLEFVHGVYLTGAETSLTDKASGAHLYLRGAGNSYIERCHFYRMSQNIYLLGGAWLHIKDNLFFGVWDDANPSYCEGQAAILCDIDPIHGHCVECRFSGNNFAGPKKTLVGYAISTADGVYHTTVADNFTYVMAAANAIDILALESGYIHNNYFGGANRYGIAFTGKDRGDFPFNPFNIRITDNMFDPCLAAQVGFISQVANCYAWNIVINGNTFVGDRNGRHAIQSSRNATTNTTSVIGLQVTGNTMIGHFGSAMTLDAALGFNVTGNTISDYNKLGAATADNEFVSAVAVRSISAKGLIASNIIGGGNNFGGSGNCVNGITVELTCPDIVQSGNHRVGTTNWTAQTYPT